MGSIKQIYEDLFTIVLKGYCVEKVGALQASQ